MKTINSLRSKLLTLTLALMASVSIQAHDFSVDGIYYNILDGNNVEVTFKGSHVNQYVNEYINSINIPNEVTINNTTYTVTRVGDGAFYACRTLNSVTIPNSVTYIGDTAFYSCDDLTTVDVGNAVTRIGDGAFFRCSFLSSITIPNSVTRIGNRAFKYCYSMTSVNIGSSVTEIGEEAFDGCTILNSVTIPNSVINIGAMAFQGCTYMTSVVIGNNVANIGNEAFRWCYSLTSVKCHNTTPPILGENIFEWGSLEMGPYQLDTLYVPAESLNLYKEAEQWNLFNSILPIKETSYKSQWCDTWNVMEHDMGMTSDTEKTWRHYLANDTIINGQTYTSVNYYWTLEESKVYRIALVRFTEDQKVYALLGDTEYLVYDFSVQVGDTIETIVGVGYGSMLQQLLVHQIDIDGATNRKTITLYPICRIEDDEYDEDWVYLWDCCPVQWIEGVGSTDGFLMGYPPCGWVGGIGCKLLCAYKDDELQYINDLYQDDYGCEYNATEQNPADLFPTLWGLQRTHTIEMYDHAPNDGKRSGGYPLPFASVKDTVINGKTYLQFGDHVNGSNYSLFFLREENNKVLIYSSILQNDLVLYDYTLKLGDSLPAITSDHDYFSDDHFTKLDKAENIFTYVVTDVSTITLLDGIERKKWILKNKYLPIIEYVEGIGCYGENTSHSGDFFRLIHDHPYTTEYVGDHLVCVSKNGQLLYSMPQEEMNSFTLTCECLSQEDTIAPKDLFPTLWGLQRTTFYHYTECSDSYSSLTASNEIVTINDKPYLRFGKMFLREENNQVLIYSAAYDKDLVLYDWNLEVGDSISLLAMDYGVYPEYAVSVVDYRVIVDFDENGDLITDTIPTDKVAVDKISTITLLDGKEYKTWHLATGWAGGITYVEGIGILSEGYGGGDYLGLIRPEELPTCYYGDLLVCVSKNNKLLYQMDPVKMDELGAECLCEYNSGPKKDNAKNGKIGGRPTPTQWNMLEVETKEMDGTPTIVRAETFSYTLENDSIVTKGKTFYQLAHQSTKDTAITKSFVGALHFGEDEDNRVYFLRDGVEYVLYDFTAEIGDTVEIFAGINNYPHDSVYTHVVTGKDTLENGACRMLLEVVFPEETNATATHAEKIWLAGLGSVDGIVHNAAKRTSNAHAAPARSAHSSETESSVMLCAWREDSCLYTTNHPDYETFGCVYNQDPTAVERPTSPSSYQKILHEGKLMILHNGKIYNVLGVSVK